MLKFIDLIKKSLIDIFARLSKNSNNKSLTRQLICDTCGKLKPINGMRQVFGGICICDQCIDKILALYVSSNPIKTLCPYCCTKENTIEKCKFCHLELLVESKNND